MFILYGFGCFGLDVDPNSASGLPTDPGIYNLPPIAHPGAMVVPKTATRSMLKRKEGYVDCCSPEKRYQILTLTDVTAATLGSFKIATDLPNCEGRTESTVPGPDKWSHVAQEIGMSGFALAHVNSELLNHLICGFCFSARRSSLASRTIFSFYRHSLPSIK